MPIAAASVDYVRGLLRAEAGIVLDPARTCLIESRLWPLARRANVADVEALVGLARGPLGANLRRQLVSAMVAGETSFFRDPATFECLRREVLPALIAARRAERSLAIWCAAAATGQEPYSVAMLVHEHVPELLSWQLTVVATDLSAEALARARAGRYNQLDVNRGLPAALAGRYFEREGDAWQIAAPLRSMVMFRELNLIRPWPPLPAFDVVLLRHVIGDLEADARQQVLDRVAGVLRPDGYLLVGPAEAMALGDGFEPVGAEASACYRSRQGQAAAL
jgi:chemotaxis protein methyltransferase CheR